MDNKRDVQQNCGLELARPYVNRQIYGETFDPSIALKKGTLFPELDLVESNNYNATKINGYNNIKQIITYKKRSAEGKGGCDYIIIVDTNNNHYELDSSCI